MSEKMTARETDVITLALIGRTNREIGEALFISENTVKTHMENILAKLEAKTRTEAVYKFTLKQDVIAQPIP